MRHFIIYLYLLIAAFTGVCSVAHAQKEYIGIGTPQVVQYAPEDYRGGTQTWSIDLSGGYVFYGNNDGLLVFDGSVFNRYPLPNRTIVRSVMAKGDRIYVGGQNEFGYFSLQENGDFTYTSLSDNLPPSTKQRISDVWTIHEIDSSIIYQSDHHLISFRGQEIEKIIEVDPTIIKSSSYNGRLLWFTAEQALFEWRSSVPTLIGQFPGAMQLTPSHLYPVSDDSVIITTLYQGFKLFHNGKLQPYFSDLEWLSEKSIYTASVQNNEWYLGTTRDGIFRVNQKGELLQHYSVEEGLQNNTVLSLAIDTFGNIWAGLDRGIDFIPTSSPFHVLYPDEKLRGTGYSAYYYNGAQYFATNNGLYVCHSLNPGEYRLVKGSEGQVWRIQEVNGKMYISHHKGLFKLHEDSLALISPTSGSWLLRSIPGTNWYIEGTYEGMNLYQLIDDELVYKKQINGFSESSRYISIDDHHLWVAHPYKGLFGLTLDEEYQIAEQKIYKRNAGLGTDLNILTFQLANEVVFTGKHGIYQYNKGTDSFAIHVDFAPFFDSTSTIKLLREGATGDLWFVEGDRVGYLAIEETSLRKSIKKHVLPALPKSLTAGFEFVLPEEEVIVLPVDEGFILIERSRITALQEHQPTLRLNQLIASGRSDTVLQLGFGFNPKRLSIPAEFPSIEVDFALDNQALSGIVQFQYRLIGYEEEWSNWTTATSLRYNYLQPGDYTLEIRSRMMDQVTEPTRLPITVVLPWFKRPAAIITFLILVGIALLGIALIPSIRFQSAKRKLEYSKVKEIRAKEQQFQSKFAETQEKIDQLEAEKMQADLDHQAKELASTTMHLVQKGEMLTRIKDNLTEVNKIVADPNAKKQIRSMIRTIEADVNFDETWQNFEHKFDKVHVDFNKRLKEQYPSLTPNDIKLCTYLKLNLTSKEIASLTNISVRGVEISRYRLRKKLGLESHENLVEFIQEI